MEVTELTLWVARLGVLALMYLFLLALVLALRADVRATNARGSREEVPVAEEPATPLAAALRVVSGTVPITGHEYRLFAPMDIGREAHCEISIPNHFISKRHARIYRQGDEWVVEDLDSKNGTLLNGEALSEPRVLTPGDRLLIGDTEIEVR